MRPTPNSTENDNATNGPEPVEGLVAEAILGPHPLLRTVGQENA